MDPWIIETSNQTPQVVNPALWCLLTCVAKFLAVGFNKHSKEELDVDELFRASAPPKLSCLHLGSDYFEAVCTPACTRHEPHPHSCVVFRFFFFFFLPQRLQVHQGSNVQPAEALWTIKESKRYIQLRWL
jgi:hypothetical protein